jgi:hypothetical protein
VLEFLVLFSLAAVGSLVCVWADLALKFVARKSRSETVATGPGRGASAASAPHGDPVLAFGFTLACYGAISLVLVSALPGALALERTCLVFAVLCVGGLLSEISNTTTTKLPTLDGDEDAPALREPLSPRLSLTLALMLNLAFAVVSAGQGLIQIVPPPKAVAVSRGAQEMEPIIVVARRTDESPNNNLEAL